MKSASDIIHDLAYQLDVPWHEAMHIIANDPRFDAEVILKAIAVLTPEWAQRLYEFAYKPTELYLDDEPTCVDVSVPTEPAGLTVNELMQRLLVLRAGNPAIGTMRVVVLIAGQAVDVIGVHLEPGA